METGQVSGDAVDSRNGHGRKMRKRAGSLLWVYR